MINRPVKRGLVGVSRNTIGNVVLLQTTDEDSQTRVSMTREETLEVIERLQQQLDELEKSQAACPSEGP